jgi:hypothetical protein
MLLWLTTAPKIPRVSEPHVELFVGLLDRNRTVDRDPPTTGIVGNAVLSLEVIYRVSNVNLPFFAPQPFSQWNLAPSAYELCNGR